MRVKIGYIKENLLQAGGGLMALILLILIEIEFLLEEWNYLEVLMMGMIGLW